MGTTTKEITRKLREQFADAFLPVARNLRKAGFTDWEIVRVFNRHIELKQRHFYNDKKVYGNIGDSIRSLTETLKGVADSKIKILYYDLLRKAEIKFKFQYKISIFRADFLIEDWLVFEIDGSKHDKGRDGIRDAHLKQLGYETFRVPAWLAASSPAAVIENIKESIAEGIQ